MSLSAAQSPLTGAVMLTRIAAAGGIDTAHLADDAVTTAKLANAINDPVQGYSNLSTTNRVPKVSAAGTVTESGVSIDGSNNITAAGLSLGDEVMDTYDEGTWTIGVSGSTGAPSSITYSLQQANYTRIGRVVHVEAVVTVSAITGGTGNIVITGFPFAFANRASSAAVVSVTSATLSASANSVGIGSASSTNLLVYDSSSTALPGIALSEVGAGTTFWVSGEYEV